MKIQLIWSAADWSTFDVSAGYSEAFKSLGHTVQPYMLNERITIHDYALNRYAEMTETPKPSVIDVLREASLPSLIHAAVNQPDVVLLTCAMGFHPDALVLLRNAGFPIAMICTECPYDDEKHQNLAGLVDLVFVNDKDSVEPMLEFNQNTFYLPTAYSPAVHIAPEKPSWVPDTDTGECDVLFVGTGFPERQAFLEAAFADPNWPKDADFQIYGFFNWEPVEGDTAGAVRLKQSALSPFTHEPIDNRETAWRYSRAKIVINLTREGHGYSMNPRSYEIAAIHGGLQIAQPVDESLEVFGHAVKHVYTPEDLAKAVAYYLRPSNEFARNILAEAAFSKVVHRHSYHQRARFLISLFQQAGFDPESKPAAEPSPVTLSMGQPVDMGVS